MFTLLERVNIYSGNGHHQNAGIGTVAPPEVCVRCHEGEVFSRTNIGTALTK